jgi:hypothetical protein
VAAFDLDIAVMNNHPAVTNQKWRRVAAFDLNKDNGTSD